MSNGSTLYRFKVSLSDVDRSVYDELDFRVAMHSSETEPHLITRVLAYVLNVEDGLEFSQGLATPDEAAIYRLSAHGGVQIWIDIGNPAPRRIHRAAKAARTVRIYTHKDPETLVKECEGEGIHRASEVELFSFDPKFLQALGETLAKQNSWILLQHDGQLTLSCGERTWTTTIGIRRLA